MTFKLMDDDPPEILLVHGIVGTECGGIIIEDDRLAFVRSVVATEIIYESRQFTLKFDVERFEDIEPSAHWLSSHNPVDVSIVIHPDADGSIGITVVVRPAVQILTLLFNPTPYV